MAKCSKCGATIKAGEKFCGNCGAEVREEKETKKIETSKKIQEQEASKERKSLNLSLGKIIILAVVVIVAFVCALFKDDISYKFSAMKEDKIAEEKIEAANIEGKWYDGTYDIGEDIDEGRYHIIALEGYASIYIYESEEDCKKYNDELDSKYLISEEYLSKGEEASVKLKDGNFIEIEGLFGYEEAK